MFRSRRPRCHEAACVTGAALLCGALLLCASPVRAAPWVVRPEWVKAHEDFLASAPLQGRGSTTRDEAIAAAYVASEFESYGLKPAPGIGGYTQVGNIVRPRLARSPTLALAGGAPLASLELIIGASDVRGSFALFDGADPGRMPTASIVVVTDPGARLQQLLGAAEARKVKLLVVPQSATTQRLHQIVGAIPAMRSYLEGSTPPAPRAPVLASLSGRDIAELAHGAQRELTLTAPIANDIVQTTNAIGFLPGTDPNAGVLLVSAHLDHLGMVDGTIMPGANDDASGTTAVLELAHALASGPPMRRGILFVCYGSEEIGGLGSRYSASTRRFASQGLSRTSNWK